MTKHELVNKIKELLEEQQNVGIDNSVWLSSLFYALEYIEFLEKGKEFNDFILDKEEKNKRLFEQKIKSDKLNALLLFLLSLIEKDSKPSPFEQINFDKLNESSPAPRGEHLRQ